VNSDVIVFPYHMMPLVELVNMEWQSIVMVFTVKKNVREKLVG